MSYELKYTKYKDKYLKLKNIQQKANITIQYGGNETQLIIVTKNITLILGINKKMLEDIRDMTLESPEINIDFTTLDMKLDNYKIDIIKQFKLNKDTDPYLLFKIKLSEPNNYKIKIIRQQIKPENMPHWDVIQQRMIPAISKYWDDYPYKDLLDRLKTQIQEYLIYNQFKLNINESITKSSLDEYNDDSIFYFNEEQLSKLAIDMKRVKELLKDNKSIICVYDNTALTTGGVHNPWLNNICIKKDTLNSIIGCITYNKYNNIDYMNTLPIWYYNRLRVLDFFKDYEFVDSMPLYYDSRLL